MNNADQLYLRLMGRAILGEMLIGNRWGDSFFSPAKQVELIQSINKSEDEFLKDFPEECASLIPCYRVAVQDLDKEIQPFRAFNDDSLVAKTIEAFRDNSIKLAQSMSSKVHDGGVTSLVVSVMARCLENQLSPTMPFADNTDEHFALLADYRAMRQNKNLTRKLGKKIQVERSKRGLTQDRLAMTLKVNLRTLLRWEHGETAPRPAMVQTLATFFRMPLKEFLSEIK